MRIWDIRPYAPTERCVKVFTGVQHNFEKVSIFYFKPLIKCHKGNKVGMLLSSIAFRHNHVILALVQESNDYAIEVFAYGHFQREI